MDLALLPNKVFITGTDTEVGKTFCTALMVQKLISSGYSVFPFKPIAAGVDEGLIVENEAVNEDAYQLWLACHRNFSIKQINPILLPQAIAPHIAAEIEHQTLNFQRLDAVYDAIPTAQFQFIEGAGGWHLPLNNKELMSDWVINHKIPVILVVGIKLGCLNHALLTAEAIYKGGGNIVGWIANVLEGENDIGRKNIEYLDHQLKQRFAIRKLFEVSKDQEQLD